MQNERVIVLDLTENNQVGLAHVFLRFRQFISTPNVVDRLTAVEEVDVQAASVVGASLWTVRTWT